MRKRTGMFLKQGLAVLLSLSMVPGPWSPGIVPAFAAQSGSGAATASDAEQDPGASAASSSDALFDEEGFLKDGEVKDDVSGEIIPESDLKTEKIEAMGAGSEDGWYSEYEYVGSNSTAFKSFLFIQIFHRLFNVGVFVPFSIQIRSILDLLLSKIEQVM